MLEWGGGGGGGGGERRQWEREPTISRGGRILEVSFRPKISQRSIASVQGPCLNGGGGGGGGGGGVVGGGRTERGEGGGTINNQ